MWGCPLRGKCGTDASGARFTKHVRQDRLDARPPTPDDAEEIQDFSASQCHHLMSKAKHGAAYDAWLVHSRSAMLAITLPGGHESAADRDKSAAGQLDPDGAG